MRITTLLLTGSLCLASTLAMAARPTVAVLPFSMDKRVVVTDGRNVVSGIVEDQSTLLTNELVHQLVATRKFDVLERSRVDDLVKEKQFQESDYASPDEAPKIAKLLGADYFVLGRIDDFNVESEEKTIPYSTQTYIQQEADIDLYLRIIDARTGKIVAAEKFQSEAKLRVNPNKKNQSVGKDLVSQATQEMVSRITNAVYPVKVAKIDGKVLYLNRGADGNLKVGDLLSIYSQGEAVTDQDTGEVLGSTENPVAQAKVISVEPRFTKAELQDEASKADIKEGMLAKKLPPAKAVPADLPPGPRW